MAKRERLGTTDESTATGIGIAAGTPAVTPEPRSLAITRRGVRTGEDFADLMSALMSDVIEGSLNAGVCNAAVNAGGKLLKVVEMQYRYGRKPASDAPTPMVLSRGGQ